MTKSPSEDLSNPWQSAFRFSNTIPDPTVQEVTPSTQESTEVENEKVINESAGTEHNLPQYVDYSERPLQIKKQKHTYTGLSIRSTISSATTKSIGYAVSHFNVPRLAAPWEHEIPRRAPQPLSHTVREFNPRKQRRRLWTNSTFQFLLTLAFCCGLAGTLRGYQTNVAMTPNQKHAFNAVVTMLSIALGLNIASSFQGYAQMLRWRFLASKYRTLQEFELVMQCDSQMKVIRLLWTARTRGKLWVNKTQWLCMVWVGVNALLQVLVALLGLTYNLDSSGYVNSVWGTVSVANLSVVEDLANPDPNPNVYSQFAAAQAYGIQGEDYNFLFAGNGYEDQSATQTVWVSADEKVWSYRFFDQNPDDPNDLAVETWRTIASTAHCQEFQVVKGGYGDESLTTYVDEKGQHVQINMQNVSPGAITYNANMFPDCGDRCAHLFVLQSANKVDVFKPHFFSCFNNVSHVSNWDWYGSASQYDMPSQQARIIGGAIGYSGFYYSDNTYQSIMYSEGTWWSPFNDVDHVIIEHKVMDFCMGAVAAMDIIGPRFNVSGYTPVPALVVDIDWKWAATILSVIPGIQLLALLCIIAWANKAIIKDTSALSTARLLRPIVDRLEDRGCLLTGDEIAEEMRNVKVAYGYREPAEFVEDSDMCRHVDILEETEGLQIDNRMPQGRYDGIRKRPVRSKRRMSV